MDHKGPVARIDWFQVLTDLSRRGLTVAAIAHQVGIPKATLMGWKNLGHEPRHADGERMLKFWARVMAVDIDTAPRTHAPEWMR